MTSWAIVVGINEYPGSGLGPLKGAVADACDFADWALDPTGGNVAPERLYFWTYPWPDADPDRPHLAQYLAGDRPAWTFDMEAPAEPVKSRAPRATEIVDTIQDAGRKAYADAKDKENEGEADGTEPRRVYVFFAGHGVRAKETNRPEFQTCFVAGNFRPKQGDNVGGVVACASLREALFSARFTEVLLFLDCCRLKPNILTMTVAAICDPKFPASGDSWGLGQAAQDEMAAYEIEGPPVRGAFSKVLVQGLRNYREPLTGMLRIADVKQFVLKNIETAPNQPQIPFFDCQAPPRDPLILQGKPTARPGPVVDLSGLPKGTKVVLKDGMLAVVGRVAPLIAGPDPIPLPPLADGLYQLEVEGDPSRRRMFAQPLDRNVDVR